MSKNEEISNRRKRFIKEFHKQKPFTRIYDVRVKGQSVLDTQLTKRVNFYKESGGEIKYF